MAALGAIGQTVFLLAAVGAVVAVRLSAPQALPGTDPIDVGRMTADELKAHAADRLDSVTEKGAPGYSFEVVQVNTLHARPDGPRIELRGPDDPATITEVLDEHRINILLSRGGVTPDAFWMEILVARDETADFGAADLFARILERDGRLWRDDGAGWYLTDASPGVGMDPVTARALADTLRSLDNARSLESADLDGRSAAGIRGTSSPTAYPGVIAADGAAFTEPAFAVDCWFDDQGRLVKLVARARNLRQETYDLVSATTITFTYAAPGEPPDPTPTLAPEPLPTSEPEAAEVAK